ncbi:hypothetical protein GQ457_05G019600 [Hibiscus cannabinus]
MAPPEMVVVDESAGETQVFSNKRINVCLTRSNYLLWKQQVVLTIRGLGLEGYLDGSITAPAKIVRNGAGEQIVNPLYLQFVKQDSSLASWLLSTVSADILPQLVGSESTRDVWSALEHVATILNGLPIEYEPSVAAITASKDTYYVDSVVSILIDAESRLEDSSRFPVGVNFTKLNTAQGASDVGSDSSVSDVTRSAPRSANITNNRYKGRPRVQCQLCGKLGHLVDSSQHSRSSAEFVIPPVPPGSTEGTHSVVPSATTEAACSDVPQESNEQHSAATDADFFDPQATSSTESDNDQDVQHTVSVVPNVVDSEQLAVN